MKHFSPAEAFLVQEVTQISKKIEGAAKGLSIGKLVKMIRTQLGMSQQFLAKRAGVPQSTISRVEQEQGNMNLSTLEKILEALSCGYVIAPILKDSVENIRRKQARKIAKKQVNYLKGTMHLEDQQPDPRFMEELVKREEDRILYGSNAKLWVED